MVGGSLCVVLTVVRGVTLRCPHCITSLSRLGWVQPPLAGGGWMLGCWTLASSQLASPRPGCNMAPVSSPLYTSQSTSPLPMSQAFHPHCRSLRHQQDRGEERILGYKNIWNFNKNIRISPCYQPVPCCSYKLRLFWWVWSEAGAEEGSS